MSEGRPDDDVADRFETVRLRADVGLEELRRRNVSALAVDALYLFTTAFLVTLAIRGFWPAVVAAGPLAAFLYFAWRSSRRFFLAQLVVVALTVAATRAGVLPL